MAPQAALAQQMTGLEKASLLLISLGTQTASAVLQQFRPEEVQMLCTYIAKQQRVDIECQDAVIENFIEEQQKAYSVGGLEYAKEVIEAALGPVKAQEIMAEIVAGSQGRPFDWLKTPSIPRFAACLQNERPQVISLVLAHLHTDMAADVISLLPDDLQGKVAYRLTSMRPVAPETVRTIEEIIQAKLMKEGTGDLKTVGGLPALVAILNNADRPTEGKIIEYLEQAESEIAETVKQMMFVFEDIVTLEDRAVQLVIRELEPDDLRLALKGGAEDIRNKIFKNMSERAAETLKEDLELLGAVKRKDVEAAQRKVISIIRRLDEVGEISLRQNDEDLIK